MTRFWQPHHSFPATATILVMGLPGEPRDRDLEFWGSQKRPVRVGRVGWVVKAFPKKVQLETDNGVWWQKTTVSRSALRGDTN